MIPPTWICIIFRMSGILITALLITGCPVPIPAGYPASSRENLDTQVLGQLVAGVSTREDVLLLLGEPDNNSPNDTWLVYGSVYGKGGVLFVLCGAGGGCAGGGNEKMEYQRLLITFDEGGVMSRVEFASQDCWEGIIGMGSSGGRSEPCIQVYDPPASDLGD